MSQSSILGGTPAPTLPEGTDVDRLGPSDRSDSGSDVQGEQPMITAPDAPDEWGAIPTDGDSQTDALGTGERSAAAGSAPRDSADIRPDRIVGGRGAGADVDAALDELADDATDDDDEPIDDAGEPAPRRGSR